MFDKNVKIVTVDKDDKVEVVASAFRHKIVHTYIIALLSVCVALYFILNTCAVTRKENILKMDYYDLKEYINSDKAEMVYNYVKENGLEHYSELEEINGIGHVTVETLETYTYIGEEKDGGK